MTDMHREAFERWLTENDTNPESPPRNKAGRYVEPDVQGMYETWQAALRYRDEQEKGDGNE